MGDGGKLIDAEGNAVAKLVDAEGNAVNERTVIAGDKKTKSNLTPLDDNKILDNVDRSLKKRQSVDKLAESFKEPEFRPEFDESKMQHLKLHGH